MLVVWMSEVSVHEASSECSRVQRQVWLAGELMVLHKAIYYGDFGIGGELAFNTALP